MSWDKGHAWGASLPPFRGENKGRGGTSCPCHWCLHVGPIWAMQSLNSCKWGRELGRLFYICFFPGRVEFKVERPHCSRGSLPLRIDRSRCLHGLFIPALFAYGKKGGVTENERERKGEGERRRPGPQRSPGTLAQPGHQPGLSVACERAGAAALPAPHGPAGGSARISSPKGSHTHPRSAPPPRLQT